MTRFAVVTSPQGFLTEDALSYTAEVTIENMRRFAVVEELLEGTTLQQRFGSSALPVFGMA